MITRQNSRTRVFLFCTLLALTLSSYTHLTYAQTNASNKQVIAMLRNFYTNYVMAFNNDDNKKMQRQLFILQNKYCTKALLDKIEKQTKSGDLDSDPFLRAQDSDNRILASLNVSKDLKKKGVYIVTYKYPESKEKTIIHVAVIKEDNKFKISDVW